MKNKGNITRPPVSSMQIYCILISALLSVVRVYASTTADSVYFHIKADTMREIRAGQVVELTYALSMHNSIRFLLRYSTAALK